MRTNSEAYNAFNQASLKELRLVVVLHFSSPLYLTSHAGIPNIPADKLEDVLQDVSSTSQRLVPDEGRSEIGSMSFSVVDVAGAVTSRFRTEQAAGTGLRGLKVELYRGGSGMDWSDFRLEQTQQIDADVTLDKKGVYHVSCADIQREMRQDIFDLAKTRLAAELAAGATTMTVFDTSAFVACSHVASFGDEPSGSWYYLKVKYTNGFEIIKATGKTATTFTGLTRGMFGTDDVLHELPVDSDADSGVEVEEYPYLELPAPAMAYTLLTGNIIGGGTIPWHLGIDTALVDQDSFENIGEDWFDSSDYTKGLIFRFQNLTKTDGKRFIEREVCLLAGAFLKVGADGIIYLRRMTGVIGTADHVAEINPDNAITHGAIKHDLSKVRNTFDIEWSWIHIPGEQKPRYARRNILIDASSIAVHKAGKPLHLQFKGLHADRHTLTTLRNRFDSLRDRYAGPPIIFPASLLPSMNDLEVGDIVRANFPNVRDYSGDGALDRACEIERITINQRTGRVQAELFSSTRKADPIADDGAGAAAELPDGWYDSLGTAMTSVLTIDGSGFLTADGTLAGGTTTRTVYYYLGDFTIQAGRTLEVTGNVELHIRGHFQVNGTLLVTGGMPANTLGFFGSTFGGRAVGIRDGRINTWPGPRRVAVHQVMPAIEIENVAGVLAGIPNDMRGTGGANGGNVWEWDGSAMVEQAAGGAGGAGGGSVVIVSRGAGYGVSGETVLSGEDGSAGTSYDPGNPLDVQQSGSGGGGAPGCLLHVLDGSQVTFPVLAGFVVAEYGTSPITGFVSDTQGKATASDPFDMGVAAARVVYVPKSRDPYPDFENDQLNPDAVTGFLSHEAHVVHAATDGTGYSLTGAGGTFNVFQGINDKTGDGPVYSVQGTATKNGLTMAIDAGTGAYSLSGASWTSDSEFFTLRAVYLGVTIDKVYAIAKARRGAASETTYYIKPTTGTAIRNGTGTLTIEARQVTPSGDTLLSTGTIKLFDPSGQEVTAANGYVTGSDGYTGILDAGDITGGIVITLKDGASGDPLDTITLVDIADGADGDDGAAGLSIFYANVFRRSASAPATPTGGSYNFGTGVLTPPTNWSVSPPASDGNPLYVSTATFSVQGTTGTDSSTTWTSPDLLVQDGDAGNDGDDGLSVHVANVYRRSASAPSTPTGGSYNFGTRVLTPPTNWSVAPPASDGNPLYVSTASFSVTGTTGTDSSTTWSSPDILVVDGDDGAAGANAVFGFIEPENGLAWSRASDAGAWSPTQLTTDLDCTFVIAGTEVARIARRITLTELTGALASSTTTHKGGDLNTGRVTVAVSGGGTTAVTVKFTYSHDGFTTSVAETVKSVQSGLNPSGVLVNGDFEAGDTGWTPDASWSIVNDPTNARFGSWCAKLTSGTSSQRIRNNKLLAVSPGDKVLAQIHAKVTGGTGAIQCRIQWLASDGSEVSRSNDADNITSSTYDISRSLDTAPAGTAMARLDAWQTIATGTTGYIDGCYMDIFPRDGDVKGPGFVLLPVSVQDDESGAGQQTAGIRFTSDGLIEDSAGNEIGKWWNNAPEAGIGASYEVVNESQLAGSWDIAAASLGTWIGLGSDRLWQVIRTVMEGVGTDVANSNFQIRDASTETIEGETIGGASAQSTS